MNIIAVLIFFSLLVAVIFLLGFIFSVRSGQYDDIQTPAHRILFDDRPPEETKTKKDNDHKKE